jgi:glycosyltransferase involved in cell wall biosynthesis
MLRNLVRRMDRSKFANEVISLTSLGELAADFRAAGIPVMAAGLRKRPADLWNIGRLGTMVRKRRPDVVQTWMYHADLIGGVASRLASRAPVIWGVHHSSLSVDTNKFATVALAKLCAVLSRYIPERIVCCSESARTNHAAFGYKRSKTWFIPNGFEVERFQPDLDARATLRNELGADPNSVFIGMAARYHQHKDHATFLAAAAQTASEYPAARFVLCGSGVTWGNRDLSERIDAAGLRDRTDLLGPQKDMNRFYNAMDIMTSSSMTEAFPLTVGEAMSSGRACVVTDVGDSAFLVGDTGVVVPAQSPGSLAAGWRQLLNKSADARCVLGQFARDRIVRHFSLPSIVRQYEALYASVAAHC